MQLRKIEEEAGAVAEQMKIIQMELSAFQDTSPVELRRIAFAQYVTQILIVTDFV